MTNRIPNCSACDARGEGGERERKKQQRGGLGMRTDGNDISSRTRSNGRRRHGEEVEWSGVEVVLESKLNRLNAMR